jgi:hypothetical protein
VRVGGVNKYPETKGTKNYAQNKTFKNLQKLPSWRGRLEGTINTPLEGTNNYAGTITSDNPPKIAELEGTINTPSEGTNNYA